jgi:hypothetical protein
MKEVSRPGDPAEDVSMLEGERRAGRTAGDTDTTMRDNRDN